MEFLGDSVLGLVAALYLLRRFPAASPGHLTRLRSLLLNRQSQARLSRSLKLSDFAALGKGMADSPRLPRSVLANLFEAVVGAMYLDGGLEAAEKFLHPHFDGQLQQSAADELAGDQKSQLQEVTQRLRMGRPKYRVTFVEGPPHSRRFEVEMAIGDTPYSRGTGSSKKEAEKNAASAALAILNKELVMQKASEASDNWTSR